jgi:hypothetical protein
MRKGFALIFLPDRQSRVQEQTHKLGSPDPLAGIDPDAPIVGFEALAIVDDEQVITIVPDPPLG